MSLRRRVECVPVESVRPPSPPALHAKVDEIANSMRRYGWLGRPLVVVPMPDRLQSLVGSHRHRAARLVPLDRIPVIRLTSDEAAVVRSSPWWSEAMGIPADQDEIARDLRRAGHRGVAELILADTMLEGEEHLPWASTTLDHFRRIRYSSESIEVLATRSWAC